MIEPPPVPVQESLISSLPILIGRADENGVIQETEGTLPHVEALGSFAPRRASLLELFPEDAADIRGALAGGNTRVDVRASNGKDPAHFEMRVVADRKRGGGAYFLVHDVTETRELQLALLDCTDREQVRIGHELHDTLGQDLAGVAYQLHALVEGAPPELSARFSALQQRVSDCLRKTRDIAFTLGPQLCSKEIERAFARLCAHIQKSFDVKCDFKSRLDHPITDDGVTFHLFRIAQEACANAARHAAPRRIEVRLATGPENVLEISDDGDGVAANSASEFPGMGIPMMKFRARALRGR